MAGEEVILTYTGFFTFALSIFLIIASTIWLNAARFGRSMRAVAEDKQTACLNGDQC